MSGRPEPEVRFQRTKTMDVRPAPHGGYTFRGQLTDISFGGVYHDDEEQMTIHDFIVTGEVKGSDLEITSLDVEAATHPYAQCPFVLPATRGLLGRRLATGWRHAVLDALKGARGCTHVTTLLLGLNEVQTMVFFLQMNARETYAPAARVDGSWMSVGLDIAPQLVGACHALTADGPVLGAARSRQTRATDAPEP